VRRTIAGIYPLMWYLLDDKAPAYVRVMGEDFDSALTSVCALCDAEPYLVFYAAPRQQ
jgi:hypothetical protein